MSKILHVGITAPTYSSEAITKAFGDTFGQVIYLDWQAMRYNAGVEGMRTILLTIAEREKPDYIFLHLNHNSEVLSLDNIKELSELSKLITYTEDVREDISWFETIMPYCTLQIFTNKDDVENLGGKSIHMPVSYNDIWYKKQTPTQKYYGDIVFLGNNYVGTNLNFPQSEERQQMIIALKKEFGDKFQAYGNGQENPMLNPQQAVECYNNAKIAITQNNFKRKGYQSDRGLNSVGCGCATIFQYYEGLELDNFSNIAGIDLNQNFTFKDISWRTVEELIYLCHFINNNLIINHVQKYQYKIVSENHRWINRAQQLKQILENGQ